MGTNTGIGNANAIGFKSRVTGGIYFPPELKDALVGVWSAYGKSNDSTDRNIIKNKIKDRGGDFVISNAAFKLNSGFGKYEVDFTSWIQTNGVIASSDKVQNSIIGRFLYFNTVNKKEDVPSFKVNITLGQQGKLQYNYIKEDGTSKYIVYSESGIYTIPASYFSKYTEGNAWFGFYQIEGTSIIEQIPSLEGAFVTDGINDLITSTKTVQEMLGGSNEITVVSMMANLDSRQILCNSNFSNTNGYNVRNTLEPNGVISMLGYTDKNGTTNNLNLIMGDKDSIKLVDKVNFNSDYVFYPAQYYKIYHQVAWYWTFIAKRALTTDEINQVIAYYNLDKYVKPDIYYNVKKQGLTNDTPDEDWYLKDFSGNGRDMTLYNYARTPESGINEEGGLQLDGVVDYGQFVGDLGLKDYTVVIDRAYNNLINNQVSLISSNIVKDQTPFIVEHWNTGSNAISFSYGASRITDIPLDINKKIVYQSTYSYMGYVIPKGNAISTGDGITLGKFGNGVQYSAICLWSLMLFPYSMSEFLIERQLKKHKLGTLYPDMVEFRPVIKTNVDYTLIQFYINNYTKRIYPGDYIPINTPIQVNFYLKNNVDELISFKVNGNDSTFKRSTVVDNAYNIETLPITESPQKINITIDEYIRYEDIVQPYPSLFTLIDYDTEEVYSWGSKLKVGARFKGNVVNLLPNMYEWQGNVLYNGEVLDWGIKPGVVAKEMVFSWNMPFKYLIDNNEPKVILSPRLLRIPNSSYKILGYIPDISGHGNHGVIHNSAYAEGSGVNEDGSYQFDGVDDFVTIPTTVGGKQVLMKVNWQSYAEGVTLYDQRLNLPDYEFAIYNGDRDLDDNPIPAYQGRNNGQTYIDGLLNNNIKASELRHITHNITITNELSLGTNNTYPVIGSTRSNTHFAQMSLYDFMLFDNISTDDKIKELNEYVGIEAKVELPPYYWDTYGKTNSDADRDTIQQRGVAVGDYDLTNYNHAYEGMSGYNGYPVVFGANKTWESLSGVYGYTSDVTNTTIHVTHAEHAGTGLLFSYVKKDGALANIKEIPAFRVTIGGLEGNSKFGYRYLATEDATEETLVYLGNGTHELAKSFAPTEALLDLTRNTWVGIFIIPMVEGEVVFDCDITIEVLPEYENGLAYDGITDYSKNANIPVLTDYTYIYKRTIINIPTNAATLLKGADKTNGGAFIADYGNKWQFNFGQYNTIQGIADGINWQTVNSFNGTSINKGENTDDSGITVAKFSNGYTSMVFYKLILYPKTISLLEINFLKNLMEKDEIIDLNNPIFIKNE